MLFRVHCTDVDHDEQTVALTAVTHFFTRLRPASMLSKALVLCWRIGRLMLHFASTQPTHTYASAQPLSSIVRPQRSWRANRRPRALMQHAKSKFGKGYMAALPGLQSMQATLTLPGPACDEPPSRCAAGLAGLA